MRQTTRSRRTTPEPRRELSAAALVQGWRTLSLQFAARCLARVGRRRCCNQQGAAVQGEAICLAHGGRAVLCAAVFARVPRGSMCRRRRAGPLGARTMCTVAGRSSSSGRWHSTPGGGGERPRGCQTASRSLRLLLCSRSGRLLPSRPTGDTAGSACGARGSVAVDGRCYAPQWADQLAQESSPPQRQDLPQAQVEQWPQRIARTQPAAVVAAGGRRRRANGSRQQKDVGWKRVFGTQRARHEPGHQTTWNEHLSLLLDAAPHLTVGPNSWPWRRSDRWLEQARGFMRNTIPKAGWLRKRWRKSFPDAFDAACRPFQFVLGTRGWDGESSQSVPRPLRSGPPSHSAEPGWCGRILPHSPCPRARRPRDALARLLPFARLWSRATHPAPEVPWSTQRPRCGLPGEVVFCLGRRLRALAGPVWGHAKSQALDADGLWAGP